MFEKQNPGYELLEKSIKELEILNLDSLNLSDFLKKHNLYMTAQDIRTLRTILKYNKKWKLYRSVEYKIVRRGKKR
jgi:hypothetical protein